MKKVILIFICGYLWGNLCAQSIKRDLTSFNQRIDSLTLSYSVKQWKELYRAWLYFDDSNLNDKEKKLLIYKIKKLYEQNEYANLYRLGYEMIDEMWNMYPNNNSLEIKQMLMELYLQYYFYPKVNYLYSIVNSYDLDSKKYYTKKAKQRIIEILENKKTKEEFAANLKDSESSLLNSKYHWEEAARIMKKGDVQNAEVLKQIRDSLLNDYILYNARNYFESLQIETELIRMTGLLDMKECIPVLKQNLLLCPEEEYRIREQAYRYALAWLGDKEQWQYIMDNFMDINLFNKRDFAYFRDDKMIWKYIEVNYHKNEMISIFGDGEGISASLMTMNNIYPYIKNLPKELEYPYLSNDMQDCYNWEKILYKWIMENKDKVKFDYDGEKKWVWR
ncbi:hypothetical protein FACS1894182_10750 [Bacteroidia bacterium]|nr:hypothetical protein FACS1894182_10750 [Bacteroidia bacterium]